MTSGRYGATPLLVLVALAGVLAAGCRQDMHDQPRYAPLQPSGFFDDGTSGRQPVAGTVARGQLRLDKHLYTGRLPRVEGASGAAEYVDSFPFPIDAAALDRGQERFNIYCSVCHDRLGSGNGMIVRRGFRRPTSFHVERLREAPVGYLFDVVTNGYGAMSDYASQISVEDRWKIIAYLRALQLSQNARPADVPPEQRDELGG